MAGLVNQGCATPGTLEHSMNQKRKAHPSEPAIDSLDPYAKTQDAIWNWCSTALAIRSSRTMRKAMQTVTFHGLCLFEVSIRSGQENILFIRYYDGMARRRRKLRKI